MKGKVMNANYRQLPARFEPDTRFEVRPAPAAPFRATLETDLERLRRRLLLGYLRNSPRPAFSPYVRRAANEAAAIAWTTAYPLLLFPVLFEEKAAASLLQAERQESVRRRSLQLFAI